MYGGLLKEIKQQKFQSMNKILSELDEFTLHFHTLTKELIELSEKIIDYSQGKNIESLDPSSLWHKLRNIVHKIHNYHHASTENLADFIKEVDQLAKVLHKLENKK